MTNEINWAAPIIGKIFEGKTYVDRSGGRHRIVSVGVERAYTPDNSWNQNGGRVSDDDYRHVLDLIAEYTPPAPLKMWMNVYHGGDSYACHSTEARAREIASGLNATRIAVPVTITEGHGND
jgi:hypothetical protein